MNRIVVLIDDNLRLNELIESFKVLDHSTLNLKKVELLASYRVSNMCPINIIYENDKLKMKLLNKLEALKGSVSSQLKISPEMISTNVQIGSSFNILKTMVNKRSASAFVVSKTHLSLIEVLDVKLNPVKLTDLMYIIDIGLQDVSKKEYA